MDDPFRSPPFESRWQALTGGRPAALGALAELGLGSHPDRALALAAAAAALVAEHLAAESLAWRDRLATVVAGTGLALAAAHATVGALGLAAAALLETYGQWPQGAGPDPLRLHDAVLLALQAEDDPLPLGLPPDAALLWCCVMGEWCERNGLEAAFERVAVIAALAEPQPGASAWCRAHWRIVAAWHWSSAGREPAAGQALAQAVEIATAAGLDATARMAELQRARLLLPNKQPAQARRIAQRVRQESDPGCAPLALADAADADCRVALARGDFRQAVADARQALAWLHAAHAPPSSRVTYALREVYALTGLGDDAAAAQRLAAIGSVELPPYMAARIQLVSGLLALVRRDRQGPWGDGEQRQLLQLLAQLRELDWPTVLNVLPAAMARLFARGLTAGTELPWLHAAIRTRALDPPLEGPFACPQAWPWPVRLQLLGPFRCVLAEACLLYTSPSPRDS